MHCIWGLTFTLVRLDCRPRVARMQMSSMHDDALARLEVGVLKLYTRIVPAVKLLMQLVSNVVELEEPSTRCLIACLRVPRKVNRMLVLGRRLLVLHEHEIAVASRRMVADKAPDLKARSVPKRRPLEAERCGWSRGCRLGVWGLV